MPTTVGKVSRVWDEQNLDLTAAAGQIAAAGSGGFSAGVQPSASRFLRVWEGHAEESALRCEVQADDLRSTIRDYLDTDALVSADYFTLAGYLTERR